MNSQNKGNCQTSWVVGLDSTISKKAQTKKPPNKRREGIPKRRQNYNIKIKRMRKLVYFRQVNVNKKRLIFQAI